MRSRKLPKSTPTIALPVELVVTMSMALVLMTLMHLASWLPPPLADTARWYVSVAMVVVAVLMFVWCAVIPVLRWMTRRVRASHHAAAAPVSAGLLQMAELSGQVRHAAMTSGLPWEDAVTTFGLVARSLAADSGATDGALARARERFDEGYAQAVKLVFAGSDLNPLREATPGQVAAVLANVNIRLTLRP